MATTLQPIEVNGASVDLSPRIPTASTVAASPSGSSETIIGTITLPSGIQVVSGIHITAFAAFTVGTNGVSVNLKVRRTNTSGSTIAATGATTATAANLGSLAVVGF